jgi:transposase
MPTKKVSIKHRVCPSWMRLLKQRRRESREIAPRSSNPKRVPLLTAHRDRLHQLVQGKPDITLEELRLQLPVMVSVATLWRALRDLKLSSKKK